MKSKVLVLSAVAALLVSGVMVSVASAILLNPADSSVRLWLKGDSLALNLGDAVGVWDDQSSYATVIDSQPNFDDNPHFVQGVNNGVPYSAVQFSVTGAMNVEGNADRMYQQSNLDPAFDPLNIGKGTDMTIFLVAKSVVTQTELGPFQTWVGKRGPSSSVYTMGLHGAAGGGDMNFVTYNAQTEWRSGNLGVIANDLGLFQMTIAGDGLGGELITWREVSSDGTRNLVSAPQLIADRNASTADPFTIGFHVQGANGLFEPFAGEMAEVIVLASSDAAVNSDVGNYLLDKYNIPEPMSMALLGLGGLALLRRRRA